MTVTITYGASRCNKRKSLKSDVAPKGKKRTVRLVKWQTYLIVTNLPPAQWSIVALWRLYTSRQTIELVIRETKQSFGSGKNALSRFPT